MHWQRVADQRHKVQGGEEAYTLGEHFLTITHAVFREVIAIEDAVTIDPLRRTLQRAWIDILIDFDVDRAYSAPDIVQALACDQSLELRDWVSASAGRVKDDIETRAHQRETDARIQKALDAAYTGR